MSIIETLANAGRAVVDRYNPKPINDKSFAFSFGDPEPVLNNAVVNFGSFLTMQGDYYVPPVSQHGLVQLMGANPYHAPILHLKKNMIARWYKPTPLMDAKTLIDSALDFVTFGNAYYQQHLNAFGRVVRLSRLPALNMRKHRKNNTYIQLITNQPAIARNYIEYTEGEVIHIKITDVGQDIYGVPEYVGGIQSILLSEAATLFRRKYFVNGAHLGYILVTNDANINDETAKQLESKIKEGKGAGNFRSIYMNIPRSASREPVKIIPVGDIGTKDEFQKIKEVTEMEMCAMHRVYPSLAAIIPSNTGGFGNIADTLAIYKDVEVIPLQKSFLMINDIIGKTAVVFE